MTRDQVTVFRTVHRMTKTCDLGCAHEVSVSAAKKLGPVVGTEVTPVHGSGQTMTTEVRLDRQGRRYVQHTSVDFYSSVWWVREDGEHFGTRPKGPPGVEIIEDVLGRVLYRRPVRG